MAVTKYMTKLMSGRRTFPFALTGLTSQGDISPNVTPLQHGRGSGGIGTPPDYPCSLAARSVQIYLQVGSGGESHGPNPFVSSGNTGPVSMSMMYGYDLDATFGWFNPGHQAVNSGVIHMGSDGNNNDS